MLFAPKGPPAPPPAPRAAPAPAPRHVAIALEAPIDLGGKAGLDTQLHFLEGSREEVARYVFILDAINFGSGWFSELGVTTDSLTERLTAHARAHGPWTAAQLRALDVASLGATLGLTGPLAELYTTACHQLGEWLGDD